MVSQDSHIVSISAAKSKWNPCRSLLVLLWIEGFRASADGLHYLILTRDTIYRRGRGSLNSAVACSTFGSDGLVLLIRHSPYCMTSRRHAARTSYLLHAQTTLPLRSATCGYSRRTLAAGSAEKRAYACQLRLRSASHAPLVAPLAASYISCFWMCFTGIIFGTPLLTPGSPRPGITSGDLFSIGVRKIGKNLVIMLSGP